MAPQSFSLYGRITFSEYNYWITLINELWGDGGIDPFTGEEYCGYGQPERFALMGDGDVITALEWDALLDILHRIATHQMITIDVPTSTTDPTFPRLNEIASIREKIVAALELLFQNRTSYDPSHMTEIMGTLQESNPYVPDPDPINHTVLANVWGDTVEFSTSIIFPTDKARCSFFVTGGQLTYELMLRNPGPSTQSLLWATILTEDPVANEPLTITLGADRTASKYDVGSAGPGFDGMTQEWQILYTKLSNDPAFPENNITVWGRLNDSLNSIDLVFQYNDKHYAITDSVTGLPSFSEWTQAPQYDDTDTSVWPYYSFVNYEGFWYVNLPDGQTWTLNGQEFQDGYVEGPFFVGPGLDDPKYSTRILEAYYQYEYGYQSGTAIPAEWLDDTITGILSVQPKYRADQVDLVVPEPTFVYYGFKNRNLFEDNLTDTI